MILRRHNFKTFLKHLKNKDESGNEEEPGNSYQIVAGPGGNIKGLVVFAKYEDLDDSSSCFEHGAFLSIGHAGCNSTVRG